MGQYSFARCHLSASVGCRRLYYCPRAGRPLGARAVERPTLRGGPLMLRPVRATPCFVNVYATTIHVHVYTRASLLLRITLFLPRNINISDYYWNPWNELMRKSNPLQSWFAFAQLYRINSRQYFVIRLYCPLVSNLEAVKVTRLIQFIRVHETRD